MSRRALVATGMLVAGGFLLLQAAWMLTMPRATGIDEFDHVYRAASVATGDWGFSHQKVDHDQGRPPVRRAPGEGTPDAAGPAGHHDDLAPIVEAALAAGEGQFPQCFPDHRLTFRAAPAARPRTLPIAGGCSPRSQFIRVKTDSR